MQPKGEPDFVAEIRILTEAEGGRRTPPMQGIRWDLRYAEDPPDASIYMIWPWFLDAQAAPIPEGALLYGTLVAQMHVQVRDMVAYHQSRLSVGTEFHYVEGRRICAVGHVTGLFWV